jgi:hypothetical protein
MIAMLRTTIPLVLISLPFALRAAEIQVDAKIILPHGKSRLIAGENLHLHLTFTNKSDTALLVESIRPKGVEQLSEEPIPLRSGNIVPAYVDTLILTFTERSGKRRYTRECFFPIAGTLQKGQSISVLLPCSSPDLPGQYSIQIAVRSNGKTGNFAIPQGSAGEARQGRIGRAKLDAIPFQAKTE